MDGENLNGCKDLHSIQNGILKMEKQTELMSYPLLTLHAAANHDFSLLIMLMPDLKSLYLWKISMKRNNTIYGVASIVSLIKFDPTWMEHTRTKPCKGNTASGIS